MKTCISSKQVQKFVVQYMQENFGKKLRASDIALELYSPLLFNPSTWNSIGPFGHQGEADLVCLCGLIGDDV